MRSWRWPGDGSSRAVSSSSSTRARIPSRAPWTRDRPTAPTSARRRLSDGREFRVVKVFHEPRDLEAALRRAGFRDPLVETTSRFFLLGRAIAA